MSAHGALRILEEAGDYSSESVSRMAAETHGDVVWRELIHIIAPPYSTLNLDKIKYLSGPFMGGLNCERPYHEIFIKIKYFFGPINEFFFRKEKKSGPIMREFEKK